MRLYECLNAMTNPKHINVKIYLNKLIEHTCNSVVYVK